MDNNNKLVQTYNGHILSGIDFNRIFKDFDFVKLTNENETFDKTRYKDGLNINFNKYKSHNQYDHHDLYLPINGIYFIERKDAHEYIYDEDTLMCYIRKVKIPDNAIVHILNGKFKTYEIILAPREPIDSEMYSKAVMNAFCMLEYVPETVKNRELCMNAVTHCGILLKFVPETIKDKDICMAAVEADGAALKYVPTNIIDKDICMKAVKSYGIALKYVPLFIIDKNICTKAVKKYCRALKYVPLSILDKDICMRGVRNSSDGFEYIPAIMMDKDICIKAVGHNCRLIQKIPLFLLDKDICMEAVRQNSNMLEYVPENLKDKQMCSIVINHGCENAKKYVPLYMSIQTNFCDNILLFFFVTISLISYYYVKQALFVL